MEQVRVHSEVVAVLVHAFSTELSGAGVLMPMDSIAMLVLGLSAHQFGCIHTALLVQGSGVLY